MRGRASRFPTERNRYPIVITKLDSSHEDHGPDLNGHDFRRTDDCDPHLGVALVSTLDLNRPGGLETYVRSLTRQLQGQVDLTWNGQRPRLPYRFDPKWARLNARLLSLMTRPRTRWISRSIAESVGQKQCSAWLRKPSVMHYVGTGWNLLGFPATRVAQRLGLVKTCWPAIHPQQWGDSDLDFDLYRKMDAIFVQSDFESEFFRDRGIKHEALVRCDLAPSAVSDGDKSRFLSSHQLEGRELILYLGRKCPLKGYQTVRRAASILCNQGRPVTLVSVGSLPDTGEPQEELPELPDHVDLDLGRADEQEKADALAACDVMVLPSIVESFGIVYTEAWAYAKPVICGPSPASRELIERYQGGLAATQDPVDVAEKLNVLLDDDRLRRHLGSNGKRAIETRLCWSGVADVHTRTWNRLLQRSRHYDSNLMVATP